MEDTVLVRAAAEFGIEPEYTDIWGRVHSTPDEIARAILKSLGAGTSDDEISESIERKKLDSIARPLDATLVVREDAESITLRIPQDRAGASIKLEIGWEGGDVEHHWFWLPELSTLETVSSAGGEFVLKQVPLPSPLRLGYHRLRVYRMRNPELEIFGESRFIVCPKQALRIDRRAAGVALSLYGLRSARNWGCGDFTDLRAAIDALAPAGVAFIALNPLHAIPNREPYNTSPYLPECSLYRNFIYLDVGRVAEEIAADSLEIVESFIHLEPLDVDALRASEFVEYERVAELKLRVLRDLFQAFLKAGGSREFDRYIESEGAYLRDFAVYCALYEEMHRRDPSVWIWTDWPEPYRDPRSRQVAEFVREHEPDVLFHKFLQWKIDGQLADVQAHALEKGMRIGLYHDLALATDRYGADLWANRRFYAAGCRVGSPPDDFSPAGQDWSFPPPAREAHLADGYELFAQSIRKNARHGGALRIDHVMRFFRLWWIPDGMPATEGAYVRDYWRNLLGVLALESVRGQFVVIGEDLGTVTGEVRQALTDSGILGYRVLWFERNPDGTFRRPDEYPAQAAASTTTHDLPTLAGFFSGRDIEARRAAGLIDDTAYQAQIAARKEDSWRLRDALRDAGFPDDPIGFLLSTPCALAIINQEDLTGETEQQNLPGSTWQHPNWRRKMKVAVEDFGELTEALREKIRQAGRIA